MTRRTSSRSSSVIGLLLLAVVLLQLGWLALDLVGRMLIWLVVGAFQLMALCVCHMRARHAMEHAAVMRRLEFEEPRPKRPDRRVAQTAQTADPDEVRQIMRQLGRHDAAARLMAERILAAAPRRPLVPPS